MSFAFNFFDASEGKTVIELLLDEEEGSPKQQVAEEEGKKKKKAKKSKKKTTADALVVSLAPHVELKEAVVAEVEEAEAEASGVKAVVEASKEKTIVVAAVAGVEAKGQTGKQAAPVAKAATTKPATTQAAAVVEEKKNAKSKPKKSKQKGNNKKVAASQEQEEDDESWYSPQQQNVVSAPSPKAAPGKAAKGKAMLTKEPHFVSSKDPLLDELAQRKIKFGDGKNLVAIGPPKRRDPSWLSHGTKQQQENAEAAVLHSSPFAFGFL